MSYYTTVYVERVRHCAAPETGSSQKLAIFGLNFFQNKGEIKKSARINFKKIYRKC